jgi:P27 family predicted phage terminase small subunit
MAGRRPTPTYLKLLRGNPGKRPINKGEPQPRIPETAPEPPAWLSPYAKEEWLRIAPELHRMRLLTPIDVMSFGAYCESYSDWRSASEVLAAAAAEDPTTGGLLVSGRRGDVANPLVGIISTAARAMLRFAGEFGCTPVARSRINTGDFGPHPPSKWDGLLT